MPMHNYSDTVYVPVFYQLIVVNCKIFKIPNLDLLLALKNAFTVPYTQNRNYRHLSRKIIKMEG